MLLKQIFKIVKATAEDLKSLSILDIRVGRIVDISKHSEGDELYVEKVDIGETEPRVIVSGLVKYCSIDMLKDSPVIVLANLKPRSFKGVMSHGMLLCSSTQDHSQVCSD
jgi:methionine--tRNA ligase beta chain